MCVCTPPLIIRIPRGVHLLMNISTIASSLFSVAHFLIHMYFASRLLYNKISEIIQSLWKTKAKKFNNNEIGNQCPLISIYDSRQLISRPGNLILALIFLFIKYTYIHNSTSGRWRLTSTVPSNLIYKRYKI